jgi:cell division protein FtsB
MKKILALILACFLVSLSLTACGSSTNTSELTELTQHINTLESELAQRTDTLTSELTELTQHVNMLESELAQRTDTLKQRAKVLEEAIFQIGETPTPAEEMTETLIQTEEETDTSTPPENAPTETMTTATIEEIYSEKLLDILRNSDYPDHYDLWLKIAESDRASEAQLLIIAEKCEEVSKLEIPADPTIDLARKISENPATTDAVMQKLAGAYLFGILDIVASSTKSGEGALLRLADLVGIENPVPYYVVPSIIEVAQRISENPAATNEIMLKFMDSPYSEIIIIASEFIQNH